MSGYSIAKNFDQYFRIRFASTKELQQEAYKIRYSVYADELGWEPSNDEKIETDECDDYAYHCLLEHRRTGTFAGCIRLIIPPSENPQYQLPFEQHCMDSLKREVLDTNTLPRGGFGEISRLAVLASFRRREQEKNKPYILSNVDPETMYSEEERRNFPNIAIGLYLGGLALAAMCNHIGIMVMMETRLNRRLQRFGLPFDQIGEETNYHGRRAMFYLRKENFYCDLNEHMRELYDVIEKELKSQISLHDYGADTRFKIPEIYRNPK